MPFRTQEHKLETALADQDLKHPLVYKGNLRLVTLLNLFRTSEPARGLQHKSNEEPDTNIGIIVSGADVLIDLSFAPMNSSNRSWISPKQYRWRFRHRPILTNKFLDNFTSDATALDVLLLLGLGCAGSTRETSCCSLWSSSSVRREGPSCSMTESSPA